jgi:hypothetical protein
VPIHTAGDYTSRTPILFDTEEKLMQYFEEHPFLIEYSLIKVSNYRVE